LLEFLAVINRTNCPCNKLLGGKLAVMVTVSEALCVASVVEVAVMVTAPPAGSAPGAVNVVAAPLAVCAEENEPHIPGLPQVTVQSTPAFAASLLTVATRGALPASTMDLFGTPWVMATERGATMVTTAVAVTLPAAVEVAVMVTAGLGVGGAGGAVNVAGAPLAVCDGTTVPQGVFEQLTVQVTPELLVSLATTAVTVAVPFVKIVVGGAWVMLTVMGAVTINEAVALKLWSAVAYAVSVTVAPTRLGNDTGPGTMKVTVPPAEE
jgi:hypothetical protein